LKMREVPCNLEECTFCLGKRETFKMFVKKYVKRRGGGGSRERKKTLMVTETGEMGAS